MKHSLPKCTIDPSMLLIRLGHFLYLFVHGLSKRVCRRRRLLGYGIPVLNDCNAMLEPRVGLARGRSILDRKQLKTGTVIIFGKRTIQKLHQRENSKYNKVRLIMMHSCLRKKPSHGIHANLSESPDVIAPQRLCYALFQNQPFSSSSLNLGGIIYQQPFVVSR